MDTTSPSASPWSAAAARNGPFPRRSLEVGAIIVGFFYFWPAAIAYVAWKIAGYPALGQMRAFAQSGSWPAGSWPNGSWSGGERRSGGWSAGGSISRFARAFDAARDRGTGNRAFDAYRDAEIEKLEARRRALQEESRAFTAFVEELKRTKDREEFDAFMQKQRAQAGRTDRDGPVIDA